MPEQAFMDVNEAFLNLTGHERHALIGAGAGPGGFGMVPPQATSLLEEAAPDAAGQQRTLEIEHEIRRHDGQQRAVLATYSVVTLFGKSHLLGAFHDVTRRKELEREVVRVSDETRHRIAGDLHDELGQQLVAAVFQSDRLGHLLEERGCAEEAARARRVAETTREALDYVRRLSHQLSPAPIENSDSLQDALAGLAEHVEETFAVQCRFHAEAPPPAATREATLHLYRIAQEATTNAVKHGRAATITISLHQEPGGTYMMRVCDDGVGIEKEAEERECEGIGLRTMCYRAGLIGGMLRVRPASTAEGGTVIECRFAGEALNADAAAGA